MVGNTVYLVCRAESGGGFLGLTMAPVIVQSIHTTHDGACLRRIEEEKRRGIPHFILDKTLEK